MKAKKQQKSVWYDVPYGVEFEGWWGVYARSEIEAEHLAEAKIRLALDELLRDSDPAYVSCGPAQKLPVDNQPDP